MKTGIQDKDTFSLQVLKTIRSMGLKVLESAVDYYGRKPDAVAVYPDKKKYYLLEIISEKCLRSPSPRLYLKDEYEEFRSYCRKLFAPDEEKGAVAAAVLCDLASGLETFTYKIISSYDLVNMKRYGTLAVPVNRALCAEEVLNYLNIDFRTLDILDKFTLVLISRDNSERLEDAKRFVKFILSNR